MKNEAKNRINTGSNETEKEQNLEEQNLRLWISRLKISKVQEGQTIAMHWELSQVLYLSRSGT